MVAALGAMGADLNAVDSDGQTALHLAVEPTEVIEFVAPAAWQQQQHICA